MQHLEGQSFIKRYARQDENKSHIEQLTKVLDEAIVLFGVRFVVIILLLSDIHRGLGKLANEPPPCESGAAWRSH